LSHSISKKRSHKAGLPPGTPVHIGSSGATTVSFAIFGYDGDAIFENSDATLQDCVSARGSYPVVWVNVRGVHDTSALEALSSGFGVHALVIEDVANTVQRPKLEDYGETLYAVFRLLRSGEMGRSNASEQVSLILGINFVLSFEEGVSPSVFESVRERLRTGHGKLRQEGADFLFYSLMDALVDSYFSVLERVSDRIEILDDDLMQSRQSDLSPSLHRLKRDMIWLRKSIWPVRELLTSLERGGSTLVRPQTRIYLRDVYDHTVELIDTVETYRDILSSMLEIHLSMITNRLNEVMKVLTVIATIFIPLTFITGIYGMNFRRMPELDWVWGYPLVLGAMTLTGGALFWYFRRRRWI